MSNQFFGEIDWKLLREQKSELLKRVNSDMNQGIVNNSELLMGIVHLIDHLQDYAVDKLGYSEKEVFNLEE